MPNLFSRAALQERLAAVFQDHHQLRSCLNATPTPAATLPTDLKQWLARLMLLYGVPINYLVPDEGMLPPESIRFFYVDMNWVDAMLDGAFSIGRNLTTATTTATFTMDRATLPTVKTQTADHLPCIRANFLGVEAPPNNMQVVSGFLLRSSVVLSCPGLGVNAYPLGGTPADGDDNITLLNILRMEQLGPQSDTLLCLLDGDAVEIDIHEPPEGLHYGIDSYSYTSENQTVTAIKQVHPFTKTGSVVTMNPSVTPVDISSCFRSASPRVVMMSNLATQIAQVSKIDPAAFDSAEMGFEMTEGVGMVAFHKKVS
ncbi:TPA: hypothetical protein DDW35_06535 [Candidatus Sumerlaeota bacterium]|nr:hypothetical protein [Candidatus Sumerlaeota bacterium]